MVTAEVLERAKRGETELIGHQAEDWLSSFLKSEGIVFRHGSDYEDRKLHIDFFLLFKVRGVVRWIPVQFTCSRKQKEEKLADAVARKVVLVYLPAEDLELWVKSPGPNKAALLKEKLMG